MNERFKVLQSPWFLLGLLLLLLNDHVWKDLYGNWITGKLSDFAGLFIFPIFWTCFFPRHKRSVFVCTAIMFAFWKSPLSQGLIDLWNGMELFPIGRVVDYTDLMALAVLPIAYRLHTKPTQRVLWRLSPILIIGISAFSFLATSYYSHTITEQVYVFDFPLDTLKKRIYYHPALRNFVRENRWRDSTETYKVFGYDDTLYAQEDYLSQYIKDTMHLQVIDSFCFQGYTADVIIGGEAQKSAMLVTGYRYRCPKNGRILFLPFDTDTRNDKFILDDRFEEYVIVPMKE